MRTDSTLQQAWTPRSRVRTNLLLAAVVWTCVGIGLSIAGVHWLSLYFNLSLGFVLSALLAVVLGVVKFRFVLIRTARRVRDRIVARGDGKCIGGMFSWGTWLLILSMMSLGAVLRRLPIPLYLLGTVYLAVGVALAAGSSVYWLAWRYEHSPPGSA